MSIFRSALTLLRSKFLRLSKGQKRKPAPPVQPTPEQTPVVAPAEVTPPPSDERTEVRYERKMGDSEVSYYLPSRANGVNDMYQLSRSYRPEAL